ncbi:MAG: photosynthetic reaction center cytochrome PufC [Deltaproteobacteria bacterium]
MTRYVFKLVLFLGLLFVGFAFANAMTATETGQYGYSGTGMEVVAMKDDLAAAMADNVVPDPIPAASKDGELSAYAYENVKVLGHLTTGEFTRLMVGITAWVAPEEGCNYCHNPENMASDEVYTKVVSRRMLQMTMQINSKWGAHVAPSGVTCFTCHRGQPVPKYIWFDEPASAPSKSLVGDLAGQNVAAGAVGVTSLPFDPFNPFLEGESRIRVVSDTPLPTGNRASIKQAEWTYGLMMHMSDSLGVNCSHCHNTRAMAEWSQSPAPRAKAWYGIRMARELNNDYLVPLADVYPEHRLGRLGDPPKANCKTCHRGVYKPLLGAPMLKDYPSLAAARPAPPPKPEPEPEPTEETDGSTEPPATE